MNWSDWHLWSSQMGRWCTERHGNRINMAFLDGHVQHESLNHLWDLDWAYGWKIPAPMPSYITTLP
jgi:prepilin-type processing-associated H-X9-DG protein